MTLTEITEIVTLREHAWELICTAVLAGERLGPAYGTRALGPGQFSAEAVARRLHGTDGFTHSVREVPGYDHVARLLRQLAEAGLVRLVRRPRPSGSWASTAVFELTEAGREAAGRTLRGLGAPGAVGAARAEWQQDAWTAMRIHTRFCVPTILRHTVATYDQVYRYCRRLVEAGVLRRAGRREGNGRAGSHAVFAVRRDPGPEPPLRYGPQAKRRNATYV